MSNSVDRPGGVTLVAVLTWIGGALDILGGTILLFQTSIASTVEQFGGASQLILSAIGAILVGAIVIVVAVSLMRGRSWARVVITVFEVISIIISIFFAIAYPAGAIGEYVGAAISLVIIALLWTRRANAFFRS
ncbi:DUF7144 family membrane protein [Agromyces mariniharenae]|uniref:DUF7144 domain-containing protein n=1 Tax=Agromyces mariniharenae TaxID=2604423 RepID=A0A5S4V4S0_9MICO|nr:hypothetical protein [Agromyces mariniharenae]TYL54127.1 hypothetical protein FYC51_11110 [Agromyces mariniharenae]